MGMLLMSIIVVCIYIVPENKGKEMTDSDGQNDPDEIRKCKELEATVAESTKFSNSKGFLRIRFVPCTSNANKEECSCCDPKMFKNCTMQDLRDPSLVS